MTMFAFAVLVVCCCSHGTVKAVSHWALSVRQLHWGKELAPLLQVEDNPGVVHWLCGILFECICQDKLRLPKRQDFVRTRGLAILVGGIAIHTSWLQILEVLLRGSLCLLSVLLVFLERGYLFRKPLLLLGLHLSLLAATCLLDLLGLHLVLVVILVGGLLRDRRRLHCGKFTRDPLEDGDDAIFLVLGVGTTCIHCRIPHGRAVRKSHWLRPFLHELPGLLGDHASAFVEIFKHGNGLADGRLCRLGICNSGRILPLAYAPNFCRLLDETIDRGHHVVGSQDLLSHLTHRRLGL